MNGASELRALAESIATRAGDIIVERRRHHVEVAATKSTDVDVVTAVDREAETLIQELLASARPGDGFVGEEGGSGESTTGVSWVVDPIDGTVNFLYGIPHYAVSIAAVEGDPSPGSWDLQAGVVLNPVTGEMFSAGKGQGATLNNSSLHVAAPVPLAQALWLTGFAYAKHFREEQGRLAHAILPDVRDIRRAGTASLDLAFIAAGRGNIYFERTLSPWDHAAGELLVTEAGGLVTGFGVEPASREAIFAGHPEMVELFQQLVADCDGQRPLSELVPTP